MPVFQVENVGGSWFILEDGQKGTTPYPTRGAAQAALEQRLLRLGGGAAGKRKYAESKRADKTQDWGVTVPTEVPAEFIEDTIAANAVELTEGVLVEVSPDVTIKRTGERSVEVVDASNVETTIALGSPSEN